MTFDYEKLGVDPSKNIELKSLYEDNDPVSLNILDENGRKIGYVGICEDPDNPSQMLINNIDIENTTRGEKQHQGYGKLVYIRIAEIVNSYGKRFVSSSLANTTALRVWESLEKRGLAKKDTAKQKYDTGLYYIDPTTNIKL